MKTLPRYTFGQERHHWTFKVIHFWVCLCEFFEGNFTIVTLSRPPTSSSLRITNRSFRYASPHLWNQLPISFRQPCTKHPADDVTLSNSPPTCSPLSPSITNSLFHSRLKTHLSTNLFHHSLLAPTWTAFSDYTGPDLLCSTVFHFSLLFYFFLFWVVR